ncbi:hypothetical protein NQN45_004553 [Vibrio vulnificus]|nr:hypothetical protein [Vibrio vulnificus]EJN6713654.1 hypothetical protein [Vibrio vulnificus]MCU8269321.1 hypothetical protein [Vibrio vulnificus]
MKMKSVAAATLLAIGAMAASTSAMANGEVRFIGSVVPETCNLIPEVGGNVDNTIQLGQMKVDGTGTTAVPFALKPAAGTTCTASGVTKAAIAWTGDFNANGLDTTLDKSYVELISVNASTANTAIKGATLSTEVAIADINDAAKGAQYTVQLKGANADNAIGNFSVAAAYTVTYL